MVMKVLVASMCGGVTPVGSPESTLTSTRSLQIVWSHLWRLIQHFLLPWPQESGVGSPVQSFPFQKVVLRILGLVVPLSGFLRGRCWARVVQKQWPAYQMPSVKGAVAILSWHPSPRGLSPRSTAGVWLLYDVCEHARICPWKLWKGSVRFILQPPFVKALLLLLGARHCFKQVVLWFAGFLKSGNWPHCFSTIQIPNATDCWGSV